MAGIGAEAQPDHAADPVRPQQGRLPGDRRAPVVPGHHGLLLAERVHQRDDVAGQVQDRVVADRLGRGALAVAALVRGHRVESGRRQRDELVPPGVPALGEAVQQHHQRPAAGLGDVHPEAAGVDEPVSDAG
jgi:hypothetical protein